MWVDRVSLRALQCAQPATPAAGAFTLDQAASHAHVRGPAAVREPESQRSPRLGHDSEGAAPSVTFPCPAARSQGTLDLTEIWPRTAGGVNVTQLDSELRL